MGKEVIYFSVFIILLLVIPFVSAIETNLKQEYKPLETLIISIEGNFIDNLKAENILFYSGRVFTPMIYDLAKIQDKYYIYALLPEKERNYSLIIKNAHYYEAGQEKLQDLKFDFSAKGNLSLFTVNPGFIITDKDFYIKLTSNIKTINLKSEFLNSTQDFTIPIGEKRISFSISEIKKSEFIFLKLEAENTKYEVPVAIFSTGTEISSSLKFSKSYFNFTIFRNKEFSFPLTIMNTGQEKIENISFSADLNIISIPSSILEIEAGNSKEVLVTIKSDELGLSEGYLTAVSGENSYRTFLSITTTSNESEFQEFINETEIIEQDSCSELQGQVCEDEEECEGSTELTIDGLCCIGECKKPSSFPTKTITLIVILIILVIIAFFIYRKLRARKSSSKEIIRERTKNYEERFTPKETRGSLEK